MTIEEDTDRYTNIGSISRMDNNLIQKIKYYLNKIKFLKKLQFNYL